MDVQTNAIDWTECPAVERVADRMHGVALVKGTGMPADDVVENYASGSPVWEIAQNFGLKPQGRSHNPNVRCVPQTGAVDALKILLDQSALWSCEVHAGASD